jgi:tetratricopeptide (TPR) repeat protein
MRFSHCRLRHVAAAALVGISSLGFLPHAPAQELPTTEEGQPPIESGDDLEKLLESEQQTAAKAFEAKYPEIREAATKFSQRDFKGAEETLSAAKLAHPELPPAGVMLGKWYAQIKNSLAARTAYEMAARDEPADPEPYVVFGENALRQRRFTDAALLFDRAVETSDKYNADETRKRLMSLRANAGVAAVAAARERWQDAETSLRKALLLDDDNVALIRRLGRVLFKQGEAEPEGSQTQKQKFNAAYKLFQDIYAKSPDKTGRPEINMANLYQESGKQENAEKMVKLAIQRDPDHLATQLAAAQWALGTGKRGLLKQCADAAQRIDANSLQTQVLLGFLARLDGDFAAAESAFEKALAKSPNSALALNQMAIALVEQEGEEKRRRAVQYADMCNRIYNDRNQMTGREALVTSAWVLYKLGRLQKAAQKVELALSAGGVGPEAAYFSAVILKERGRDEIAKTLLERTLENSQRLFPNREKAEALLEQMSGEMSSE